ncbi:MAG: hypothetical protein U5K37_08670 [Natrialbaceae archaeon]|nr:hypothetical protein [Natrialbaceae archaeon]
MSDCEPREEGDALSEQELEEIKDRALMDDGRRYRTIGIGNNGPSKRRP